MAERLLVPSIEKRLASVIEVSRRNLRGYSITDEERRSPTITISREFGCEGFPVSERLKELLEKKTGSTWGLMDKALLEEVAKNHSLAEEIFKSIGEKNRFLDDMLSTFSPRWHSEKDYYKLLCKQIVALATAGNVIIVGRGSSILTQSLTNCYHFRLVAAEGFKVRSIVKRLNLPEDEAEKLIRKKQKQRDAFIKDFLNRDVGDFTLYHLIFNNGKNSTEQMAQTICDYVLTAIRS